MTPFRPVLRREILVSSRVLLTVVWLIDGDQVESVWVRLARRAVTLDDQSPGHPLGACKLPGGAQERSGEPDLRAWNCCCLLHLVTLRLPLRARLAELRLILNQRVGIGCGIEFEN